ncbi:hypothetical protein [Sphingomonas insulae]|uniref:hypothetical protein n=1 Tax=Sphingomonas insulae TaxID=424800 RepID=UPI00141BB503|nr:hypothetical protein [Sphingomonas insulae]
MTPHISRVQTRFFYDARAAGAGKTYAECDNMLRHSGLYILAVELINGMAERLAMLNDISAQLSACPKIVEISSSLASMMEAKRGPSVKAQIEALCGTYEAGHVIALVTHAGLMDADLSGFQKWNLVIDEVPSVFESKSVASALTWQWLGDHFQIIPGDNLNGVVLGEASKATTADFRRDSLATALATFHRRVASPQYDVFADICAWDALAEDPRWRWASFWSPAKLGSFRRVKFLANAFDRSLTYAVFRARHPELAWQRDELPTTRTFVRRLMKIHFFARAHRATRGLFNTVRGKRNLEVISKWIARSRGSDGHIWMCNEADKASLPRMPGVKLAPRQAGSNRYQHVDAVTALYTAKPEPAECQILEACGIDPNTAIETREYETIYQFVGRSSIRDASSSREVHVYVYDSGQANYLFDMFSNAGYIDVELLPVDLGFIDEKYDSKAGRPKCELTEAEVAAKNDLKRAQARERQRLKRARDKMARDHNDEYSLERVGNT